MNVELERIPAFFGAWVRAHGNRGAVGEIAQWLADGGIERGAFATIVGRHGAGREQWFRDGMLDLVLAYAQDRLSEGPPSKADVADVRLLRFALHVPDADFFDRRPVEVAAFVKQIFEIILADGVIDHLEDLYLVEVQTAFGLSYDQLLLLARPALEAAIDSLETDLSGARSASRQEVLAELAALEPTYRLAKLQRRSLGTLF